MTLFISPRSKLLILFFLCCIPKVFPIQDQKIESGKASAMANTSVTLTDIWSIYHNQAGLGYLKNLSIGAFHQSGFIKGSGI